MTNKDLFITALIAFGVCFIGVGFFFGMLLSCHPTSNMPIISFLSQVFMISITWSTFMTITYRIAYGKKK